MLLPVAQCSVDKATWLCNAQHSHWTTWTFLDALDGLTMHQPNKVVLHAYLKAQVSEVNQGCQSCKPSVSDHSAAFDVQGA